jgi:hypothetical protein
MLSNKGKRSPNLENNNETFIMMPARKIKKKALSSAMAFD